MIKGKSHCKVFTVCDYSMLYIQYIIKIRLDFIYKTNKLISRLCSLRMLVKELKRFCIKLIKRSLISAYTIIYTYKQVTKCRVTLYALCKVRTDHFHRLTADSCSDEIRVASGYALWRGIMDKIAIATVWGCVLYRTVLSRS